MADVRARSELERRGVYIELLRHILSNHPALAGLIEQCLHNAPQERPSAEDLLATLRRMRVEVQGEYGDNPIRLDITRVRVAKEIKLKDTRIQELIQLQVQLIVRKFS